MSIRYSAYMRINWVIVYRKIIKYILLKVWYNGDDIWTCVMRKFTADKNAIGTQVTELKLEFGNHNKDSLSLNSL